MSHLIRRIPASLLALALALTIYAFAAGPTLFRQSIAPHYVYLADALLHGRVDLVGTPSSYDLLVFDDKAFVAGSPMPAFLLMPFVAVFGSGVSDILFGAVLGALNVALVHNLFRRWWLTLLFAFGTPHLYLAALGSVWFNAHVVAIFFGLLAVRTGLSAIGTVSATGVASYRGMFLAGFWLACASLARPTMLFGAVFFLAQMWVSHLREDFTTTPYPTLRVGGALGETPRHQGSPRISSWRLSSSGDGVLMVKLRPFVAFTAAIALGIAAHGAYNAARFGSPIEFGYGYTAGAPNITSTYARYGGFNPRFLPCNLFVSILNPPEVNGYVPPITYDVCGYLLEGLELSDASAPITPNPLGMSLFVATPAFVLLFAARRRDPLVIAAWAGLLATMIPLWMYHNTGSLQFGYRYWMDAAPMWLVLLSITSRRFGSFGSLLIAASIAINVWGFLWMFEKFVGGSWFEMMHG